jgi:hypothetical protein
MIHAARAAFGRPRFDRFLYGILAPEVSIAWSGSDPQLLRWLEEGCRNPPVP